MESWTDRIQVEQDVQMIDGFHIAEFEEKDGRTFLRGTVRGKNRR
jgi:hypothetical protein